MDPKCNLRIWAAALLSLAASVTPAAAQEMVWIGSVALRGGLDSNPMLVPGSSDGSAAIGLDAAIAGAMSTDGLAIGVIAEASATIFEDADVEPTLDRKLSLTLANQGQEDWSLRSTTSATSSRSYEERDFAASQSLRVQWIRGAFRPFLTAELGYRSLNETNAIFDDFLPEPHRTLRGTIIPGVALRLGGLEIGASVNLSAIRYEEELDDFLFRRDNERQQPFLFASYEQGALSLFGSVSHLLGKWNDPDFSDVAETLYELTLAWRGDPLSLELSALRIAEETTFPISPVAIARLLSGRLVWSIDAKTRIAAYGSHKTTRYLDSPVTSRTIVLGGLVERKIGADLTLALDIGRSRGIPFAGDRAEALFAFASVKRNFGEGRGPAASP